MDCAHLTDAELLGRVRDGGEASFAALQELQRRHYAAVRAFAALSTVRSTAADELAYQAWESELRHPGGGSRGAVRPGALAAVLHTASLWAQGHQRASLNPNLGTWVDQNGPLLPGHAGPAGHSAPHRTSLVARAFATLPLRSQTLLWHRAVEHDDGEYVCRLIGAGPTEVNWLTGRMRQELHDSYVRTMQEDMRDGMRDECRHYHRLVLAYAETPTAGNLAGEIAPHLERCAPCTRAVEDLTALREDCGGMLVRALLPWGGLEYAEGQGRQERPEFGGPGSRELLPSYGPGASQGPSWPQMPDGSYRPYGQDRTRAGAGAGAGAATGAMLSLPAGGGSGMGPGAASGMGTGMGTGMGSGSGYEGPGRDVPVLDEPGGRRGRRRAAAGVGLSSRMSGMPGGGWKRPSPGVMKGAAAASIAAVTAAAVAFAFTGGSSGEEPQAAKGAGKPSAGAELPDEAATPSAERNRALIGATENPTLTAKPKASSSKSSSRPAPPSKSKPKPSGPNTGNSALTWSFNSVDRDGGTADSSGSGQEGTVFGDSRPQSNGGVIDLNGQQFVASDESVVNTGSSFTVSAQVKLDSTAASQTVVSQDSDDASAFQLQYDADDERWEFRLPDADSRDADSPSVEAGSKADAQAGEITHLVGVYDDARNEVRLYVDGKLQDTADRNEDFSSDGRFVVGRGLSGNEGFQGLDGKVDDVKAFGRALSSAEAAELARKA